MKVDVVMCTWNSNKPYFAKCLKSIKREVPIHHFILVDRCSTDGTVEQVKEVFPNAKVIISDARLAVNRKLGIELADTEFFAFVDSDIELCNGWFKVIMGNLDSKTGAIQGCPMPARMDFREFTNWYRNLQARFNKRFGGKVIVMTAKDIYTVAVESPISSNVLIRTCLIKDWNPPAILSTHEDTLLLRHVLRKGYQAKALPGHPKAIHYGGVFPSSRESLRKARWVYAGSRLIKWKHMSIWPVIKNSFKLIVAGILFSMQRKQPMILPSIAMQALGSIQGWISWNKYMDLKR